MITGKIKLRGEEWGISIGASNGGKSFMAVIRSGDVVYWAEVDCEKPAAPEVALRGVFENMVDAGDITWSELEDIADELDPNRDDALRVYLSPIRLIMMGLDGSGRSVRI